MAAVRDVDAWQVQFTCVRHALDAAAARALRSPYVRPAFVSTVDLVHGLEMAANHGQWASQDLRVTVKHCCSAASPLDVEQVITLKFSFELDREDVSWISGTLALWCPGGTLAADPDRPRVLTVVRSVCPRPAPFPAPLLE